MPGQIVILMATALIEKNEKYLILKRSKNNLTNICKWQFPEGKVRRWYFLKQYKLFLNIS